MKIVYLGSGQFGIECLNSLAASSHILELIVTQPAHPAGRGRKPSPTPAANWAKNNSTACIEAKDINAPDVIEKIAALQPDLIVVAAFGQKIGNELRSLASRGIINVHASLLPLYRGAAPINWAIINGESQTGVSIITVSEKMDAGDILAQETAQIGEDETAGQLHDRLAHTGAALLLKTIEKIADGTAVYMPQEHSKASLAPKLKKSDGFLDFSEPASLLRRKILGFWPWPGAQAVYVSRKTGKSLRVTLAEGHIVETTNQAALPVGTLDENLNIICGENALKIAKIKPDGSRLMDFEDFINGRDTRPGDIFVKIETGNKA